MQQFMIQIHYREEECQQGTIIGYNPCGSESIFTSSHSLLSVTYMTHVIMECCASISLIQGHKIAFPTFRGQPQFDNLATLWLDFNLFYVLDIVYKFINNLTCPKIFHLLIASFDLQAIVTEEDGMESIAHRFLSAAVKVEFHPPDSIFDEMFLA